MRALGCLLLIGLWWPLALDAQTRRRAPAPPALKTEPAVVECPSLLGEGVKTRRSFCDVLTGRDPMAGVIIRLPPHTGPVTLTFDLHNRHTYSEELIKTNRAYRHYTATIGVLTADNTLLTRAVVQNEFRTPADLIDRVSGGAGPGGVKAVAPTGVESITVTIPAEEQLASVLGEKLSTVRPDGIDNFSAPGRPVAVISNVQVQYRPGPVPRTPVRRERPR
ncbi:MAG: hypothetical protein ACRD3C_09260 [Vicinamibacterales bacterium]